MYAVTGPMAQALGLAQASSATSEPMTPETSPSPKVAGLVQKLIALAGFLKEMETQAHLIHLNVEHGNFLSLHKFFKEQYEAHLEAFDRIAEYVRSMDYWMPMCSRGLSEAAYDMQHCQGYEAQSMLYTYYENLDRLGYIAKEVEKAAQEADACDVANYLAELVGFAFKFGWQLKSVLRSC